MFLEMRRQAKGPGDIYRVTILDNDTNTYQEVIDICMKALQIDYEEALRIALAVDHNGRAEVLHAPHSEARRIAAETRTISLSPTAKTAVPSSPVTSPRFHGRQAPARAS